jgi:ADP-ribosylation factor-binding protein GGA
MKVSTENDNNFGYEKITIVVDNIPLIYCFQAMKVKLQPPSATDLPAYNPILPPSAITQVMLLANPHNVSI